MSNSAPDRLAANKAVVGEAIACCINTALKLPDLIARDQGAQLTELSSQLVSREQLITATCSCVTRQLPAAVDVYGASLDAVARPVGGLLAASARLEAVLASAESRGATRPEGSEPLQEEPLQPPS
ncbi:hypothetical protein GPECTOR_18g93 [Gonium pectorale]|uniref:Uncharacterized protein n=1 Tax=Gonium pectorale TaxID=33097 RepID=A0A150GJW7_GONPE|nr:hypothetical protein GPECTOR_18g93 [Gonium pectorale]|eukprot:KXZ50119.1 hypothetical protein GPECTOR_18g93 [Gonium pectorale]